MQSVVPEWGRFRPIFALSALRRRPSTQLNPDSTHILNSTGRRRPLQPNEAAHVINQVHHANLRSRTCHADGTHEYAAHPVFLIRKYVLYAAFQRSRTAIPIDSGQAFQLIADSVPTIADRSSRRRLHGFT